MYDAPSVPPLDDVPAAGSSTENGIDSSTPPSAVFEWLKSDVRPVVDDRIADIVGDSSFSERLAYQVETGGKRVRPGLTLTAAELCGLERDRALDIAACVELIHTYSLVHDDLADGDRTRRGEPTFWDVFGRPDAVNVGDMLLSYALEALPESVTERAIATVRTMTEGQQLDFDFTGRRDCTVEDYLTMVWKKTGVLLDFCIAAPQLASGTTLAVDEKRLGRLWQAFQIRDDVLDLEPNSGRDAIGSDVRAGKRTLMAVHADDEAIYDILDKPPAETSDADVEFVRERSEAHGSIQFARHRMRVHARDAVRTLDDLPDCPQRDRLLSLCEYVVARGTDSQGQ
ncbi:polyprenyl synthetase family protein [Halorussus caseinilyticus]|uniref:Polyprenyl synthetase family protein n=1 Tax=Halorussus caseinilyticus TaxID=3034025 RepID=A0ABD5WMP1_9EURY